MEINNCFGFSQLYAQPNYNFYECLGNKEYPLCVGTMRISGRRIRKPADRLSSKDDNQTHCCRHLQVFLIIVFYLCIILLSSVLNNSKYCGPVLWIRIRIRISIILVTWIRIRIRIK
jgi:hypothetical protein